MTKKFMRLAKKLTLLLSGIAALLAAAAMGAGAAFAETGIAQNWQLGFQEAATPTMEWINSFHTLILWIITAIVLFVLALLIIVMVRFNSKSNPVPSKTTHNTTVEVLWTLIPIIILVAIAIPSFRLLYFDRTIPPADLTIKAVGNQWYWTYEYPDADGMTFDSLMVETADLEEGQPKLLTVDNEFVVPVDKNVRVIVTATDVIHNWAIPAFGMKMDAIPGRLNEAWFRATKVGTYYGQCSELCGQRHAFMPIAVRVVSEADYATWLEQAKQQFATAPASAATQVARVAQ